MVNTMPAGGPTHDEVMAISLFKMELRNGDTMLDLGCGTGKVSIAAARLAKKVYAVDRRPEAITYASDAAKHAGVTNIEFYSGEAAGFLATAPVVDCAFVGGSQQIETILPVLSRKVRRVIVVNAVLVSTLATVTATMQRLGIFREAVHVQVSRSYPLGQSIMFKPIDPVYIIVGSGAACS
ncbi:methyltransferase domain-containing protein [Methanoregula sp.]|jgi:cobalt-precorrin-6B (C15)-methyltransferase|uniref:bifunctional cobalt-precorrin-7 (C(5))-methyltransferase/cobalt-precorrin-6B (C(15))-methyltransferase n=1 Tax=Methanoregula sp. TaxID=2052170 RepID=UPI0025E222D2|nr:methyltransferase domain-containing protein [Methanoregula sp.]